MIKLTQFCTGLDFMVELECLNVEQECQKRNDFGDWLVFSDRDDVTS